MKNVSGIAKLRQLFVSKILYNNTDETHFMTISEILQCLKDDYGIESYRATIKKDIDLLKEAGYDIEFIKSSQNKYHFVSRENDFETAELKILIVAVESSKFITKEKSDELAEKLSKLAGPFVSKELKRNVDVEGRIKPENERIYYIVDAINDAINQNKKISFQYFTYSIRKEKKPKHNGELYTFSPYKLVWNGDYYYVVGYSDKYQSVGCFRVDRIVSQPEILEDDAVQKPKGFDMDEYLNSMFRMYNAPKREIELVCDNEVVDSIIDRFGEDVEILANDMTSFRIIIKTAVSHIFFSWIFGFSGKVKIKAPEDVRKEYINMVKKALEE